MGIRKALCLGGAVGLVAILLYRTITAPNLVLDRDSLEFGQVEVGGIATDYVTLKNVGNEILVIKGIEPECGCTSVRIDKRIIQPGDSAQMEVSVEGLSPDRDTFTSVLINSNDMKRPRLVLPVNFTTMSGYVFTPRKFDFGRVEFADLPVKKTVVVTGVDKNLESLRPLSPQGSFLAVTASGDKNRLVVTTTLSADVPLGTILSNCRLQSLDGTFSAAIPVVATITGEFYASPPDVLGSVVGRKTHDELGKFRLVSRKDEPLLDIQAIVSDSLKRTVDVALTGSTVTLSLSEDAGVFSLIEGSVDVKIQTETLARTVSVPVVLYGGRDQVTGAARIGRNSGRHASNVEFPDRFGRQVISMNNGL